MKNKYSMELSIELEKEKTKRLEAEKKLVEKIEKTNNKFKPRILTNEQKGKFVDFISKSKGKVVITSVLGDAEAVSFSKVIEGLIVKAGWEIEKTQLAQFNKNPKGVFIGVHSEETAPKYASLLQAAFNSIGIDVTAEINKKLSKHQLELVIASKKTD